MVTVPVTIVTFRVLRFGARISGSPGSNFGFQGSDYRFRGLDFNFLLLGFKFRFDLGWFGVECLEFRGSDFGIWVRGWVSV